SYYHHRHLHSFLHDALPISYLSRSRPLVILAVLSAIDCDPNMALITATASAPASTTRRAFPASIPPIATTGFPNFLASPSSSNADRKSTRLNSSHVKISYAV